MENQEHSYIDNSIIYIKYALYVKRYSDSKVVFSCFGSNDKLDSLKELAKEFKTKYKEDEYQIYLKDEEENTFIILDDKY